MARPAAPVILLTGSLDTDTTDDLVEARIDVGGERFADFVRANNGKPGRTGDRKQLAAIFEQHRDAIACVIALVDSESAEAPPIGRWALDVTEEAARDTDDPSWRRSRRLLSLAVVGQVLLSRAAADLVGGSLPAPATLRDRGAPRPRDLSRPENVLELLTTASATEMRALQSLDAVPNNLSAPLTSFVGRQTELQELARVLPDTHLLTLTGPGGCGKTRLSLQLAANVVDAYPDGVWIADMAPLVDASLVNARVADAIGVSEIPLQGIEQTLSDRLAQSAALLVLDNCEHLTDACAALVERLVRACPRLRVIATSREPLGAEGEVTWRVPSLPLPAEGDDETAIATSEAVRLFVERARSARASFRLEDHNASAVAEICRRLDGIPLAIEFAAARARALPPQAIAEQLTNRFALLTGGSKAALPRHRTLEASLEWSYSLLNEAESALFMRVGVFAGGFDLAAAEAVATRSSLESWGVLDALTSLVDKSLVVLEEDRGLGRFSMLETMRQFAMTKLIASGEVDVARERHAAYYGATSERLAPELEGPHMLAALAELDVDLDNLRAALDWRVQQGKADAAVGMAHALWLFWQRSRADEGAARLTQALALPGGQPGIRALALVSLGDLLFYGGVVDGAVERGEEALVLAEQAADERAVGRAMNLAAILALYTAHADTTESLHEALRLHRAAGDAYFEVDSLSGLVLTGWMAGNPALMRESVEAMVSVATANGNPQMQTRAFVFAAIAAWSQGDLETAIAHCEAGIEIAAALHDEVSGPVVLALSARVLGLRGQYDEATAAAQEAIARSEAVNNALGLTFGLWAAALNACDQGDTDSGGLDGALTLSQMLGLAFTADLLLAKARQAVARGDVEAAAEISQTFDSWTDQPLGAGSRRFAALAEAESALLSDDLERARAAAGAALTGALEFADRVLVVGTLEFLAHLATVTRRHLEAGRLYGAAAAERCRLGVPVPPVQRARRDNDVAQLRDAMGVDALDAATNEGGELTLSAAAAYTRRGRGARRRSTSGWSSLTPTEVEVVKLVSEGRTNADVAAQLFITVATVKTHLVHVFAKLGVTTRAELAALANNRN